MASTIAHIRDTINRPVIAANAAGVLRFAAAPDRVDPVVTPISAGL